jgi:hypothetical protein
MPASAIRHSGYLFPDKGKGKGTLQSKELALTCAWVGADRQQLTIEGAGGQGKGSVKPNANKTADNQPDWKGDWLDAAGKKWDVGAWTKDKEGDLMLSISWTDPEEWAARRAAAGNRAPAPSGAPSPASTPAPTPSKDPDSMGPIAPSDFDNMDFNDPFAPGS